MLHITVEEAGDLCPREHELGTCGTVVVHVYRDGHPTGICTTGQPSAPGPHWGEVLSIEASGASLGSFALVLVDADPMQHRPGGAFVFGLVRLSANDLPIAAEVADVGGTRGCGPMQRAVLEQSPSGQGFLCFKVDRLPPASRSLAEESSAATLAATPGWSLPDDADYYCGVMLLMCPAACPPLTVMEASLGARSFTVWSPAEAQGPQRALLVDRSPQLHAQAKLRQATAHCRSHLSDMESATGGKTSLFLDPRPKPLALHWDHPSRAAPELSLQLRFFPADFLDPGSFPLGLRVAIELYMARSSAPLPLLFQVPAACFADAGPTEVACFELAKIGDHFSLHIPDPLRLVGRSLWRVFPGIGSSAEPGPAGHVGDCILDLLALRLQLGSARTVTLPVAGHTVILRVTASAFNVHLPMAPVAQPGSRLTTQHIEEPAPSPLAGLEVLHRGEGDVIGVVVHSMAVHSSSVSQCVAWGGPQPAVALHLNNFQQTFIATQADARMRLELYAALPELDAVASAQVMDGDGPLEVQWHFSTQVGAVFAVAVVTCIRWPALWSSLSVVPLAIQVMADRLPSELVERLHPLCLWSGRGAIFIWQGERSSSQDLLPFSLLEPGGGYLTLSSGNRTHSLAVSCILPAFLAVQQACHQESILLSLPCLCCGCNSNEAEVPMVYDSLVIPFEFRLMTQPPLSSRGAADSGMLVLQSFSVYAAMKAEAHNDGCPLQAWDAGTQEALAAWQPSDLIGYGVDTHEVRATARIQSTAQMGISWLPLPADGECFCLLPHIAKAFFKLDISNASGIELKVEALLRCPHCGKQVHLVAQPPSHGRLTLGSLPTWRGIDVPFKICGAGAHLLREDAFACARVLLCSSSFTTSPQGLMSMRVLPLLPDSSIPEVLRQFARVTVQEELPANRAAALQLAVGAFGKEPEGVLIVDNMASTEAETLHVRTHEGDELSAVTLDLLLPRGTCLPLATVCLSLLGALGEAELIYPIILSPGLGLRLAVRFAALQPAVSEALGAFPGSSAHPAPYSRRQLAAEVARLRALSPQLEAAARGSVVKQAPFRAARPAVAESSTLRSRSSPIQQHPFLERGKHHWLAPQGAQVTAKDRCWWQELTREPRPGPVVYSSQGPHQLNGLDLASGWDEEQDRMQGPSYRAAFLQEKRLGNQALREQLQRARLQVQKAEERLTDSKSQLYEVERRLAGGLDKEVGSTAVAALAAPVARNAPPFAEPAVCARCSKLGEGEGHPSKKYCSSCFDAVLGEAAVAQDDVTGLLVHRASARKEVEDKRATLHALAAREVALQNQTHMAGSAEAETKVQQQVMEVLMRLAMLRRSRAPRNELEAARAEATRRRISQAEAAYALAAERHDGISRTNVQLKQQLQDLRRRIHGDA